MKLSVNELTRLAFVWAEQDRASLADAWGPDTPEGQEAREEHRQLKAYRKKRWGNTRFEELVAKSDTVNVLSDTGRKRLKSNAPA